jgi:hypothetical protein
LLFGVKVPVPLVLQVPEPVLEVPLRVTFALFAHTVWLDPAFTTAGDVITTVSVETGLTHPAEEVTVRLYVPASARVTLLMDGFCEEDVNPFGPLQL